MPAQIGYFDSLKSVAGKVFNYLASITLTGTDGKTITCTQDTSLDEAVAMSSKATQIIGTYAAALTPAGGTITMNANYITLSYVKLGRLVTIIGSIIVSSVSSPTGGLTMNLPASYPIANPSQQSTRIGGHIIALNINALATPGALSFYAIEATTVIHIFEEGTAGAIIDAADKMKATSNLFFSFSYLTN